tara:strand:- start:102 stop:452 length:351 start_codon:yes stop_codon:yes gene_type:complete
MNDFNEQEKHVLKAIISHYNLYGLPQYNLRQQNNLQKLSSFSKRNINTLYKFSQVPDEVFDKLVYPLTIRGRFAASPVPPSTPPPPPALTQETASRTAGKTKRKTKRKKAKNTRRR